MADNAVTFDSSIDTEDAWRMVIEYIYLGRYSCPDKGKDETGGPISKSLRERAVLHAGVYVLAEKLCMPKLKKMAFDEMLSMVWLLDFFLVDPVTMAEIVEVVYQWTAGDDVGYDGLEEDTVTKEEDAQVESADVDSPKPQTTKSIPVKNSKGKVKSKKGASSMYTALLAWFN